MDLTIAEAALHQDRVAKLYESPLIVGADRRPARGQIARKGDPSRKQTARLVMTSLAVCDQYTRLRSCCLTPSTVTDLPLHP